MAMKKISEFVSATPTSADKVLFEHNGSGKSCSIGEVVGVLGRTRRDITNDLANLTTAIAEQNLEKYGYKIGDYFMGPSGYQYNLADMDTYYGVSTIKTHHCGVLVDTKSTCQWSSSTSVTAYSTSSLHSFLKGTALSNIKNDMIALFGGTTGLERLLPRTELDNAVGGWGTTWDGLQDAYVCALSEIQIYGSNVFSCDAYQTGTACKQLNIFSKYRFNEIIGNRWIWLRSLASSASACAAYYNGNANNSNITNSGYACGLMLFH